MQRKMVKILSILLLICTICVVFGVMRPSEAEAATATTLVLKVNSEWTTDSARFSAYFFGNGEKWVSMTSKGNNIYTCSVPSGYSNVIFVRMNPSSSTNSWDYKWNQTADLTVPDASSCMFTVSGWDGGSWGACSHSWNSGTVTKAATCTATGTKTYTCNYCSGTKTESIAKIAHNYAAATCTVAKKCTACGTTSGSALGHSYSSKVTTAATCTAAGVRTYTCSRCSNSYTESIAKLGHSYKDTVTAATCTAQGYTTHACTRSGCGYSYKDTYTSALGHNYAAATCTKPKTCTRCSTTSGSSLGHSYNYKVTKDPTTSASGTLVGTCSRCSASTGNITIGKLGTTYHTYKVTKAATCTAAGTGRYTWGITDYGTYYWDVSIPATGHSYKDATCTAPKTCSTCGATSGSALGHSYSSKVTTAATCTAAGVRTYTCSRCSGSYTESIAATGHSYSGGKCSSCGDTKVVSVAGTFNEWAGANMTYGSSGYTYSITLSAGTYEFKIVKDGAWLGNNGTIVDTTTATSSVGWEFVDGYNNCVLQTTGGTYTFTFNFDTNFLVITYNHTHAYTAGTVVAPTCTAKGYTVYTCACGATENRDEKAALGHNYSSSVTKAATCTADGVKTYTCSRCSDSYTEAIAKLGHSYSSKVTAPTCSAQGYTTWTCSRCSDSYKDTYQDALGHNYSYAVATNPTTSAAGSLKGTCSRCSGTTSVTLPKLTTTDYTYSETKAPTCTATGTAKYTWKTTTYGSYSFTVTLDAKGHNYGNASCTDAATCSVCGATTGSALGHSYSYAKNVAPTESAAGSIKGTCSRCGGTTTVTLPALSTTNYTRTTTKAATCTADGTYTWTWKTTTYGTYSYTTTIAKLGHSYSSIVTAPTCTAQGYTTHTCGNCGDSYKDTYKDALGHSYSSKVTTAATCESAGVKTFTCGNCAHSYTEEIAALGHSYIGGKCGNCGDTKVVSVNGTFNDWAGENMTWTENGYTFNIVLSAGTYQFKIIKDGTWLGNNGTIEDTTVKTSDIGWEFVDAGDCTLVATGGTYTFTFNYDTNFLVIEYVHTHAHVAGDVVAPTCTAKGYTVYTCPCGDSYHGDEKAALGHNYSSSVTKAATCTADGVKTYTCSRCSDSYTEVIAKLGHSYSSVVTAPTCTAQGYTTHTCGNCGDSYTDSYVDALGHNFVDGSCTGCGTDCDHKYTSKVTKEATCTEDGVNTYTCSVCDDVYTESIAKLGHSYSEEITTEATCESAGVKTFTCGNCAHSYTEEIAALGHSYVGGKCGNCGDTKIVSVNGTFNDWAGENMTWTENGYTFNIVLSAGTYQFKIIKDGTWLGNNGTIEDTTVKTSDIGWEFVDAGDCTLVATGGTYTFTFNFDTNFLVIEYVHTHAHVAGDVVAPTCTEQGYTVYTCPCGDSYQADFTDATGHSYVGDTCQGCGDVREYYLFGFINGTDYAYGEQGNYLGELKFVGGKLTLEMTTDSYVAVKADDNWTWYMAESYVDDAKTIVLKNTALGENVREKLFVPGGTTVTFTLVVNTDDTLVLSYEVTDCDHSYTSQQTKAPTCSEKGELTYTCSKCDHSYTEEIAALGHKYEATVTAPTCGAEGYTTHTCSVCGDSYKDTYKDALGHSYSSKVTTAATCESAGVKTFTCGNCSDSYTESIAALGHSYVGGKCGNCGDTKVVSVNGTFNDWAGENMTWTTNGYTFTVDLVAGTYQFKIIKDGNWLGNNGTIEDSTVKTSDVGWEFVDAGDCTLVATGGTYTFTFNYDTNFLVIEYVHTHAYVAGDVVAPTCTEQGYTVYTCACGSIENRDEVAALGHSYSEEITTEATCESAGVKTFTCGNCAHSYTEEIAALGHNYVNGTCDRCGAADPDMKYITVYFRNNWLWTDIYAYVWTEDGPIVAWPGVPATFYDNDGTYDIYSVTMPEGACVIFSGTKNDGTGASDQTPDITDAYDGACYSMVWNDKNDVVVDDIENVMKPVTCEHSYTEEVTKAPTCTETGIKTFICSECGHSYTEEISALGHSYSEKITTAATCESAGVKTFTCSCGDSYTEEIAALGHNYVDGTCDRCGAADPDMKYITVYFRNNWLWTDVYAYVWTEDGPIVAWPGVPATFYDNDGTYDIYSVTMPEGACVIFSGTKNDGSGASDQTPDITDAYDGACYSMVWNDKNDVVVDDIENVMKPVTCEHSYTSQQTKDPTCTEKGELTYTCSKCSDSYTEEIAALGHNYVDGTCERCGAEKPVVDYYLIGYINGADYGCNEDGENLGIYKFVNGQLIVTFQSDSYVFIKTGDNQNWYMFEGFCSDTTGTLYNTAIGLTDANKMFVPGGVELTFTLTDNGDDTFTLSYVENTCEHSYTEQITTAPGCTAPGEKTYTCSKCSDSYTEEIPATGHTYVNGVCSSCGHSKDDNIKIHFVNTLGWQGVVGYPWTATGSSTASINGIGWPGVIVQRDNDGYYTLELEYAPVSGQSLGILFHDFYGNQTADVLISYEMLTTSHEIWVKPATSKTDGKYPCTVVAAEGGTVISPEVNGQEVTFRYAGTATSVALAGSMNGWSLSANALTKGDDGVWSITMTLEPGVYEYKFVVNGSTWVLDPSNGNVGGYDGNSIVVVPADDTITDNGQITVVLHYYRADGNYSGWDVWFWGEEKEGAASFTSDAGNKGMTATFTVDGSKNSSLGYIIRKSDWSSQEFYDRFIDLSDVKSGTVHYYVNSGVASGSRVLGEDVVSVGKLSYANYDYNAGTVWVKATLPLANPIAGNFSICDGDGNATGITVTSATLENNGYRLTLSKSLTITQANTYKVKYANSYADIYLDTTDLFYSEKFASEYTYYGDDLGATWGSGSTTFKVWAPTALNVHVKIYDSGNYGSGNQVKYVQMTQGDKGVWSVTVPGNWHGYYYNYDVTFSGYTVEATDPYARSTGANGDRGMILNLNATDPAGWANDISPNRGMSYTDAIIYELHVREFTNDSNSGVNSAWRGNYLGLTQTGTSYQGHATGLDYLKELGVTHVQLMPVTDFNSVDEYQDGYAWGYDPKNFMTPEGSYSTDPYNGSVRVNEFKEMVQTLHENGINVTMDVVFNHAFDGGNFCYNKIVPNYFSRFYADGSWSNGSGVGNDLATERAMTRNYIVDTVLYWVEEYHIDGFRFDLAGLIDTQTIQEVVSAVHAKYPYVMFYGEGWAAGGTAVEYGYTLATKDQAWQLGGFGFFNDDYRNGIAGDNGNSWGFASGSWDYENSLANWFRASNTFSTTPTQTINYVSCHDNYCLTDKLLISRNGASWEEIAKMNRLSNSIVLMSQGVPFLYSGDEILREKKDYDGNRVENGFYGGDYANQINWSDLVYKQYADTTSDYYAGLIEFRKNHAALRCTNNDAQNYVSYHRISDQTVLFYISGYPNYECSDGIVVILNASSSYVNVDLYNYGIPSGNWQACIHGDQAGVTPLWGVDVTSSSGSVGVEGISTTVLVLGDLVHEESVYNAQPSSCGHANHNTSAMCTSCGKTVSHTYVNGTCSVCGLSQSAPATYTVYYDNSTTQWSNVNIYAWTTTAGQTKEYTGTWSGSAMTLIDEENSIYAYELPIGAANIIFNGDGSQTENLTAPGYTSENVLYSDGAWTTYTEACEHSYTDTVIEQVGCQNDGLVKHVCDLCGYSYEEVIPALDHSYTETVVDPTCVSGGYTLHKCDNCGSSYTSDEVSALRHNYVDGVCDRCGAVKVYYLFGYINGANYGSDGDEATMGIYQFVDGTLTVTFKQNSYVGVKTTDNENWYMTDGYLGEDVTSATLYDTSVGIDANKLFVPGGLKITFTLVENDNGTLTISYETAQCEHSYESVVTDPTCTEGGYTTHTCQLCGDSYTDSETEALGHNFVDGFCDICGAIDPAVCEHEYDEGVVTDPTCTEGGYTTYTCSICGHSYTSNEVEATGHSYQDEVTEPTCTEGGYTTHTCQLCGDSYTDSETEAAGHNFVDGFCDVCGAVDPATCEHAYESVVTEPTCTEGGYTTKTCPICGNVEITNLTEATGHSYQDEVTDPTCTEGGYTTHTCACGDSYTDSETEALGHSFVDGICERCEAIDPSTCEHVYGEGVVTEPTCTEGGYTTYTCTLCGHSYTDDETETVDHDYVDGICSVCGATDPAVCEHAYESVVTDPTCTEGGYTTHTCSKCGDSYTDSETEATGHSFVNGTCEHCGATDGEVSDCEHEYVKTAATATCTEPGGDKYTCSKCGHYYFENATEALGHSYVDGICERCGNLKPLSTTYYLVGWINGGNHGCEEDGANMGNYPITSNMFKYTFNETSYVFLKTEGNGKWFMCDGYPGDGVCFANLYDTSLPIQHDKVNVPGGVEITFTLIERDDGSVTLTYVTAGNCSHNWYTQTQVWPGCTTTGVMLHRCIMCADSYTTTIPANGHSYNGAYCSSCGAQNPNYTYYYQIVGWINGGNVGCEENWEQPGYQFSGNRLTMTFTEDSYIYIKTHDNSKWYMTDGYPGDDATSATFYHTDSYWDIQKDKMFVPKGRTITFTLSVRSDNTIYLSYVAASCQHTYDSWMNSEATCTSDGEKAYKCTKCDDYYTEVIKATGHSYDGTSCTKCGAVAPGQPQIYYLIGYINGANYGCEEDYLNMGSYKFVDGQLVATFSVDSYVYIKTQGNTQWFMTQAYVSTNSGTFYDTATGATEKMLVKAGIEYRFTLVENADGSLTLTYGPSNCAHSNTTEEVTAPTCTEGGYTTVICSDCGHREITNETEATGHSFVDGFCERCGAVDPATCQHVYGEGTVTAPTCTEGGYTTYICTICGYEHIGDETEMAPHDFVDGICSVCGAEEDDGMITVYFQNNWLWSDVYVYYWNDEGANAEWPGVPATWYANDGTYDIYCVTMPAGSKVIFSGTKNDGSGTSDQTPDIEDAQDGDCYYMTWNDGNAVGKEHIDNILGECEHEYEATVTEPGCKTPGYTTHTCKLCSDSYVDTHTAPVGHSFVNGTCTVCGEAKYEELQDFYLIGYINGANYGYEEDWENLGIYKFVDGKLVAHFKSDSYVFVKTGDNQGWYMTEGFGGTDIPYAELFNTNIGLSDANKLFVPGGMKITFVLVRTGEDTFILGYTVSECEHPSHTITGKCEYCGEIQEHSFETTVNDYTCTEDGGVTHTCTVCGHSYTTDTVPATGHAFVDGFCKYCGIADESGCAHEYEMAVDEGKCNLGAFTVNTCKLCGNVYHVYFDADMDWTMEKPVDIHDSLLLTKPMYSYRDYETMTSDVDTMEGWELISSELIDEELGTYRYTFGRWTDWSDWSEEEVTASETREVRTSTAFINADAVICDHVYEATVTEPTCTAQGYTTYICSVCGETYVTEYTDALGHSYESVVTEPTCTAQGYTTHTCATCGDSYTDSYTEATGHTWTDGVCDCGAYALQHVGATLTLESEVKYNLYFYLNDDSIDISKVGLLTFLTLPENATIDNASYVLSDMFYDTRLGYHAMQTQGIPAKMMGDILYLRLYAELEDGTVVYGKVIEYSAKTYATNILAKPGNQDLKNTLVAMLNYGAAAQTLLNYKTDDLMNADLTAEQQATQPSYSADLLKGLVAVDQNKVGSLIATEGAFTQKSAGVTLTGALQLQFFFLPGKTVDNGQMKLYYWSASTYAELDELTLDNADGSVDMVVNGSFYQGTVSGIAAKDLDKTVYVLAVYESDGETCMSGITAYSIEQYCRNQVASATKNQEMCEKLTIYSYFAKIYFKVAE